MGFLWQVATKTLTARISLLRQVAVSFAILNPGTSFDVAIGAISIERFCTDSAQKPSSLGLETCSKLEQGLSVVSSSATAFAVSAKATICIMRFSCLPDHRPVLPDVLGGGQSPSAKSPFSRCPVSVWSIALSLYITLYLLNLAPNWLDRIIFPSAFIASTANGHGWGRASSFVWAWVSYAISIFGGFGYTNIISGSLSRFVLLALSSGKALLPVSWSTHSRYDERYPFFIPSSGTQAPKIFSNSLNRPSLASPWR